MTFGDLGRGIRSGSFRSPYSFQSTFCSTLVPKVGDRKGLVQSRASEEEFLLEQVMTGDGKEGEREKAERNPKDDASDRRHQSVEESLKIHKHTYAHRGHKFVLGIRT